jgi:hypothetical protein
MAARPGSQRRQPTVGVLLVIGALAAGVRGIGGGFDARMAWQAAI